MSANIHNLKEYAECANAAYALFSSKDFINLYNFEQISKTTMNRFGCSTIDEFKTYMVKNFSHKLALDMRFRSFPKTITDNEINQIYNAETNKLDNFLSQTENFFSRYSVVAHQGNTITGFSATLFCYKNREYILAIRGTEGTFFDLKDLFADWELVADLYVAQYVDLLLFYEKEVKKYAEVNKLIVTGHSLGGALFQYFTITFHRNSVNNIVKETYTFNSPGIDSSLFKSLLEKIYDGGYQQFNISQITAVKGIKASLNLATSSENALEAIKSYSSISSYLSNMIQNSNIIPTLNTYEYVYHIESCVGLSSTQHWLFENTTQHLNFDINGIYLFININMLFAYTHKGILHMFNSHGIEHTVSTLYFYNFIIAENQQYFNTSNIHKVINQLNEFPFKCNFLYHLRRKLANVDNVKELYLYHLLQLYRQAAVATYNTPVAEILADIYHILGIKYMFKGSNTNKIDTHYKIVDAIIMLEKENIMIKNIQVQDVEPDKLSSTEDIVALYFLYPYYIIQNGSKVFKYHLENYISANFFENLNDREYIEVLYYIYSNINQIIQDIHDKIFYTINSDNVKKYNSYNNLISELYDEKENIGNNDFIYICK